jgi:cell division protein FtsB
LLFLLAGAWIALTLVFGTNGVVRLFELKTREKNLQARLAEVSKEHDALQRELQEPAPLALERSAREKFDLQRPGEIVYRFPRVPAETFAAPDAQAGEGDAPPADAAAPDEDATSQGESKSGN